MTTYDVINPATEKVVGTIPLADAEQTDAAIARAANAAETWRDVAPADRGRLLRRFADAVDADLENLARWRSRTPATRSATRAGRRATSATCCTTTRPRRNACSASRSRLPAASMSPSTNRSAWSA